jgi:hypothetical protein
MSWNVWAVVDPDGSLFAAESQLDTREKAENLVGEGCEDEGYRLIRVKVEEDPLDDESPEDYELAIVQNAWPTLRHENRAIIAKLVMLMAENESLLKCINQNLPDGTQLIRDAEARD